MTLAGELRHCASADISRLRMIHENRHRDCDYLEQLISCCETDTISQQASWLIKRHLEAGAKAGAGDTARLLSRIRPDSPWQTRLHLLQSIRFLEIPPVMRHECLRILHSLVGDRNKFVRAWAYDGLAVLIRQHPRLREAGMEILRNAAHDPAPSVQARLRAVLKSLPTENS
ncbi:MAG: hypothetical protein OXF74_05985 [Rhodobacteraceae bacterium]|nr:hypothetical protein [Paracoccaceae bacterium]